LEVVQERETERDRQRQRETERVRVRERGEGKVEKKVDLRHVVNDDGCDGASTETRTTGTK